MPRKPSPILLIAEETDRVEGFLKAFAEHGIVIPFPQQDLHIKSSGPELPL